ncbi:MAG: T9SS type A sorting domain-containing protein [Candidatus Kapaibacterium sp.]
MKLKILILLIIISGYYCAVSQSFIIKRTDVLDENAAFVTATYKFGFEILLDGVENSNSVSFKLNYNLSDFIRFSQWKQGDYEVLQSVNTENGDGTASLIIGVSSGLIPQSSSNTTPKVIELEFVTAKNSPNLANLRMSFERPVATALDTSGGVSLPINSAELNYTVHSYVHVWPGDTDNNGIVDHLDFVPVSQYIGMGSATKGFRSFKRDASSALWTPQRVLTWDSAAVTFADCDGNGDITTSDMLIVTYNLGKDIQNPYGKIEGAVNGLNKGQISSDLLNVIPVSIMNNRKINGFAGYFDIIGDADKFQGIALNDCASEDSYIHFFERDDRVFFVAGFKNTLSTVCDGNELELFNVLFNREENSADNNIIIGELNGIDDNAEIFPLLSAVSVQDLNKDLVSYNNNTIFVNNEANNTYNVLIVNSQGDKIFSDNVSGQYAKDLSEYGSGLFFVIINSGDSVIRKKIIVIN